MIKTISIEDKHEEIIKKKHLNLSRFVQDKLEELDKNENKDFTK